MPVVWIPSLLQSLTDGEDKVEVSGATVGEIIDNLEARFPGVKERLVHRWGNPAAHRRRHRRRCQP